MRIATRLERLALGNFDDTKFVGSGVHEFRIDYGPSYRLYYMRKGNRIILLLCGGDKSSQQRDIDRAIVLAQEHSDDD